MVDEDLKMESKQAEPHNIIEFPPESSHGGAHGRLKKIISCTDEDTYIT